jgi:hypothetical protein
MEGSHSGSKKFLSAPPSEEIELFEFNLDEASSLDLLPLDILPLTVADWVVTEGEGAVIERDWVVIVGDRVVTLVIAVVDDWAVPVDDWAAFAGAGFAVHSSGSVN